MKSAVFKISWILIFLLGATFSVLYVFGFRFQLSTQAIIPTGVVELSTVPAKAAVFLDGQFQGITPQIFRGQPLKPMNVRFLKSGYWPFEGQFSVNAELISHLHRIFLIPQDVSAYVDELGPAATLFWNPEKTGYVRIFPELQVVELVNLEKPAKELFEYAKTPEKVSFEPVGKITISLSDGKNVVLDDFPERSMPWTELQKESVLSSDHQQSVSFENTNIFLKDIVSGKLSGPNIFSEQITAIWWPKDSDDLLVRTPTGFFFWNTVAHTERLFVKIPNTTESFFLPDQELIIYKSYEKWNSINIGFPPMLP